MILRSIIERLGDALHDIKAKFVKKPHLLSTLTIAKNESMVIREFIEHYREQGVAHMYVIDNGSTDTMADILREYPDFVTVFHMPERHRQVEHYNTVYRIIRGHTEWLAVIDVDEYLFGKSESLHECMQKKQQTINYTVHWKMFSGSGHVKQPRSIRRSFVCCEPGEHINVKTIVCTKVSTKLAVHDTKPSTDSHDIQLNHYAIMSREYFEKVKMTRGDASSKKSESVRNWDYYEQYDGVGTSVDINLAQRTKPKQRPYKQVGVINYSPQAMAIISQHAELEHFYVFSKDLIPLDAANVTLLMKVSKEALRTFLDDQSETIHYLS